MAQIASGIVFLIYRWFPLGRLAITAFKLLTFTVLGLLFKLTLSLLSLHILNFKHLVRVQILLIHQNEGIRLDQSLDEDVHFGLNHKFHFRFPDRELDKFFSAILDNGERDNLSFILNGELEAFIQS